MTASIRHRIESLGIHLFPWRYRHRRIGHHFLFYVTTLPVLTGIILSTTRHLKGKKKTQQKTTFAVAQLTVSHNTKCNSGSYFITFLTFFLSDRIGAA